MFKLKTKHFVGGYVQKVKRQKYLKPEKIWRVVSRVVKASVNNEYVFNKIILLFTIEKIPLQPLVAVLAEIFDFEKKKEKFFNRFFGDEVKDLLRACFFFLVTG